jgi:outer membrane protein assembly factor BamA
MISTRLAGALLILGVVLLCPGAPTVRAAEKTFILNGFRLSGVPGINPDELTDKLKDKPGDRITGANINADQAFIADALKARHIKGQLFTTIAEKKGRVWILFDFQQLDLTPATPLFEAQDFTGNVKLSSAALAAATGLKPGDALPVEKVNAARAAILGAYQKALPGAKVGLRLKLRRRVDGASRLEWVVVEPK